MGHVECESPTSLLRSCWTTQETSLGEIVGAGCGNFTSEIVHGGKKGRGKLHVSAEEISANKGLVRLQVRCRQVCSPIATIVIGSQHCRTYREFEVVVNCRHPNTHRTLLFDGHPNTQTLNEWIERLRTSYATW